MLNIQTDCFISCDTPFAEADIVMFGAPFDSTTSFRPGTRFGPRAVRVDSFGLETYSPYLDADLTDLKICDCGDLELPFGSPERALTDIENAVQEILDSGKLPLMIGGEHLVTLGAVRAVAKKHENLAIIHLDAHTDLRDEYLGEKLSHANVMRRSHELVGDNSIFQFGIRSGEREEFQFAEKHTDLHRYNLADFAEVIAKLGSRPIYFSLDLDILDPAYFPGTGTPEPGGVTFLELLNAVHGLKVLNIVGADVCELSPEYDRSGASTAVACKIIRELLLALNIDK